MNSLSGLSLSAVREQAPGLVAARGVVLLVKKAPI